MEDITVQQLKDKMDAGEELKIIDVREPYEHEAFNIGGELIPLNSLPGTMASLESYKDKEVVIYCRSGQRSGMAQQFLTQAGFNQVRNLIGGMLHWQDTFGQ